MHNIHFDELTKKTKKRKKNSNNLSNKIAIDFKRQLNFYDFTIFYQVHAIL